MKRNEFPRKVRAEIILRATNSAGLLVCEGCGLVLGRKPFQVDHILADVFETDREKKLTADDGQLLGQECCHKKKTKNDVQMVRKADRIRDKASGAKIPKGQPIPGSKRSGWKMKMNGERVRRD